MKQLTIGIGALTLLLTGAMMSLPSPATARACYVVKIPPGFYPTGVPCGDRLCRGERWQSDSGQTICATTDFQP